MSGSFSGLIHFWNVWTDPEFIVITLTFSLAFTWLFHYSTLLGSKVERKEHADMIYAMAMFSGAVMVLFFKQLRWAYQYFIALTAGYAIVDTEFLLFRDPGSKILRIGYLMHHVSMVANSWLWKNPWDGVYRIQWLSGACYITEISTIILKMRRIAQIKADARAYRFYGKILRPVYFLMRPVWLSYIWWSDVRKLETWNNNVYFWCVCQIMYFYLWGPSLFYFLVMCRNPRFLHMKRLKSPSIVETVNSRRKLRLE